MTDAHCHVTGGEPAVREFVIGRDFVGTHPWDEEADDRITECSNNRIAELRERLAADLKLGVGEIGLDRLKNRNISPVMRATFEEQLTLAAEFHRPVVLHGAKCWGQVVDSIIRLFGYSVVSQIPSFLFHGFSRSDGLLPEIVKLNGYVSVGPSVLNDHAVNYRELVKRIPLDRLLVETDRTETNAAECPSVREVAAKVAELRGVSAEELEAITDRNADVFLGQGTRTCR